MGLMSFCDNDLCWLRKRCYRWAQSRPATDGSTHILVPTPKPGEGCDHFIRVEKGDHLRPEAAGE